MYHNNGVRVPAAACPQPAAAGRSKLMNLNEKVCLITGGSSGIGLASAKALVEHGARVAITGRRIDALEDAGRLLGESALVRAADAADRPAMAATIQAVCDSFGKIDFLFLNAGVGTIAPAVESDEALFDRMIATNLKGPFFTARDAYPMLNDHASVLFNVTAAATRAWPLTSAYLASKAGLLAMTRVLAAEFGARGIRVNSISLGVVDTPMHTKLGVGPREMEAMTEQMLPRILLQRPAEPDDIADAVCFLASDASRYVTAEELRVDGGISRG